jgi:hypothetical protein
VRHVAVAAATAALALTAAAESLSASNATPTLTATAQSLSASIATAVAATLTAIPTLTATPKSLSAATRSVHRRWRVHLHRGGDLLLDGHVAHRTRRRGAWLHALRVGLPHADRQVVGPRHRFRRQPSICQYCCDI